MHRITLLAAAILLMPVANSATPEALLRDYAEQARSAAAAYPGPSPAAGRRFFITKHSDWSCSSCHTANPGAQGRHAVTGKPIAPLAPAFDPRRFSDPARVEKWFKRNCNDTLARPCSAAEKADVIAYLLTVRRAGG